MDRGSTDPMLSTRGRAMAERGAAASWLLASLAGVAVCWLAWSAWGPSLELDVAGERREQAEAESPLLAQGPTLAVRGAGAAEGAEGAAPDELAQEVPHGPLDVEVIGPDGEPLCFADVAIESLLVQLDDVVNGVAKEPAVELAPRVFSGHTPATTRETVSAQADEHGIAHFDDVPYDGSWTARLAQSGGPSAHPFSSSFTWGVSPPPDGVAGKIASIELTMRALESAIQGAPRNPGRTPPPSPEVIRGPTLRIDSPDALPLDVTLVDLAAGRDRPDVPFMAKPGLSSKPLAADSRCTTWLTATPGQRARVRVRAVPDPDALLLAPHGDWRVMIEPGVRRLRADVPLWPEADLRVPLRREATEDGKDVALPSVTARLDGKHVGAARLEDLGSGEARVRGVLHRPGAKVDVTLNGGSFVIFGSDGSSGGPDAVHGRIWTGASPESASTGSVELPSWGSGPIGVSLSAARRAGGSRREAVRVALSRDRNYVVGAVVKGIFDKQFTAIVSSANRTAKKPATETNKNRGTLEVVVKAPPGRRASDAWVTCAGQTRQADRWGRAVFEDLVAASHVATVHGVGPPVKSTRTWVETDQVTEVHVSVKPACTLRVRVVGPDNRALGFAELRVTTPSKLAWSDVDGDVQRIDPYVGADGQRTLHNLPSGKVKIRASYGRLRGTADVELVPGDNPTLRLQLDEPKSKTHKSGTPK